MDITETAKAKLANMLLGRAGTKEGFRLVRSDSGEMGLIIDRQSPDDLVVEYQGVKVLLVNPDIAASLWGATLDVQYKYSSPTLVIKTMEPTSSVPAS